MTSPLLLRALLPHARWPLFRGCALIGYSPARLFSAWVPRSHLRPRHLQNVSPGCAPKGLDSVGRGVLPTTCAPATP
eukprot:5776976-Pyramimonas_sp.AAC.1